MATGSVTGRPNVPNTTAERTGEGQAGAVGTGGGAATALVERNMGELAANNTVDGVVTVREAVTIYRTQAAKNRTLIEHAAEHHSSRLATAGAVFSAGTVVYAVARIPKSIESLREGIAAFHDPHMDKHERAEAMNQALDTANINMGAAMTTKVLFEESSRVVAPVKMLVRATGEVVGASTRKCLQKVAPRVAERIVTTTGRLMESGGARVGVTAMKTVGRQLGSKLVPGLALGVAAADAAIAYNTLRDPKATRCEKIGATVSAIGSVVSAVGTVALYIPVPGVSQATGAVLLGVGTGLQIAGAAVNILGDRVMGWFSHKKK